MTIVIAGMTILGVVLGFLSFVYIILMVILGFLVFAITFSKIFDRGGG
jgi:hypothetical protein